MRISVFGLGYVGSVGCGCMAALGHEVIGIDTNRAKVEMVKSGETPVLEQGLLERMRLSLDANRLTATERVEEAIAKSDIAMICVGTPSTASGGINADYLASVCRQIGDALSRDPRPHFTVMVRSTSLPSVHQELQAILVKTSGRKLGQGLSYVCHPEFLREGSAVYDFDNPPKIVYGISDEACRAQCENLYPGIEAPTFFVSVEVAAMVKYADNAFHAVKVTFANEIGKMAKQYGVNGQEVMSIFCSDTKLNISPRYLRPGGAFGGSCLPKDVRALLDAARSHAVAIPMLSGVMASNHQQVEDLLVRVLRQPRPKVGIVGLAFKEGTDDVRESPMVSLVEALSGKGCSVSVYDPNLSLQKMMGANKSFALQSIPHLAEMLTDNLAVVASQSDVLVVSHKLQPSLWREVPGREGLRIIDLVGIPELAKIAGYEGIYW